MNEISPQDSFEKFFRESDWSNTDLGAISSWPSTLRNATSIMLKSKFPIFISWGPNRTFLYNEAYAALLGNKHPGALGGRFEEVWQEIWPEIEPLVSAVDRGESVYLEDLKLTVRRADLEEEACFTFSYSPLIDDLDCVAGLFCTVVETTQRWISEQALKESEGRLKLALAGAKLGTWQIDLKTKRLIANAQTSEIHGINDIDDDISEAIDRLVHSEDREELNAAWTRAVANNSIYDHHYRIIRPDGQVRWIHAQGQVIVDPSGGVSRIFSGILSDVTESRMAEEELKAAKDEAVRANRSKSQFLANMSHEIRTPVGVIQGFASLLNDDTARSKAEEREWISTIARNAYQLTSLLDELLDLSKIEADKLEILNEECGLKELVEDVNSLLSYKAKEKGIKLRFIFDGSIPDKIISDPKRLRQILINVVGNAIKFTAWGGVEVKLKRISGSLE